MRKLLFVAAVVVLVLPLMLHAQGRAGGGPGGVLGPLNSLGQEIRIPPPPDGPTPRLPDGTIDMNGAWNGGPGGSITGGLKPGETLPLLPAAKALADLRVTREMDDPFFWCLPMGVPRTAPYPLRIVQNYTHKAPTHMFILFEGNNHHYRQIFMDGRKHPANLDPTWYGHSIGWYENKDTLVMDTIGFNDKFWMDRRGTPHTEQLHIIERWTRPSYGYLGYAVTIDDPGAFSRPFTSTSRLTLSPPGDELMENFCSENNQFGIAGGNTNPYNK